MHSIEILVLMSAHCQGLVPAGGLGAGLHAFLGAKLCKGIDLVFDLVGLHDKLKEADLVLTGEGQIDFQTVFGKAQNISRVTEQAIRGFLAGKSNKQNQPQKQ